MRGVRIVGGGSQNAYLNQATATTTVLPVVAGPVEATVAGNVLVQAVASGEVPSLAAARRQAAAGAPAARVHAAAGRRAGRERLRVTRRSRRVLGQ